jgi:hypothetical protein
VIAAAVIVWGANFPQPYAFGNLNDEVVVLLHTLGISPETLLAKQAQHLEFLRNVYQGDFRAAFQFLSYMDHTELAEKLLLQGLDSVLATLRSLVKQEYTRMINKRDEQRCRILIPKSRLLFGVCDPTAKNKFGGRLKDGECFVRITQDGDGRAQTIICRSSRPSMYPNSRIWSIASFSQPEAIDRAPILCLEVISMAINVSLKMKYANYTRVMLILFSFRNMGQ